MSDLRKHVEVFWQEIEAMYHRLMNGLDVSPALHYRLEGKAQLLVDMELVDLAEVNRFCQNQLAKMKIEPPELFWQNAIQQNTVRLPIYMFEAPVFKGK